MPKPKFYNLDQIPDDDRNKPGDDQHPFHKAIQSDYWFDTQFLILINEIRGCNPETDSNEKCRAILAKIKMLQTMIDLPDALANIPEPIPEPELPEEEDTEFRPDRHLD